MGLGRGGSFLGSVMAEWVSRLSLCCWARRSVSAWVRNLPSPSKSTSLFLYHIIYFSDVLTSEMILGRNICWSLYIFNIVYYFQASVSIRSRCSLCIDDCVSTTKHSGPVRRVMQGKRAWALALVAPFLGSMVAEWV